MNGWLGAGELIDRTRQEETQAEVARIEKRYLKPLPERIACGVGDCPRIFESNRSAAQHRSHHSLKCADCGAPLTNTQRWRSGSYLYPGNIGHDYGPTRCDSCLTAISEALDPWAESMAVLLLILLRHGLTQIPVPTPGEAARGVA